MLRDLLDNKNDNNDNNYYNRAEALSKAATMYEEELRSNYGPIVAFLRGKIIRLLLIQIQQLTTDLLIAMGTIDD